MNIHRVGEKMPVGNRAEATFAPSFAVRVQDSQDPAAFIAVRLAKAHNNHAVLSETGILGVAQREVGLVAVLKDKIVRTQHERQPRGEHLFDPHEVDGNALEFETV